MYLLTSATPLFIMCVCWVLLLGASLHIAIFVCTAVNSALTTNIVDNCRSAMQIFIGYYFSIYLFFDIIPNVYNRVGLLMTIGATSIYVYYKTTRVVQQRLCRL
jgi:hypothetical protein